MDRLLSRCLLSVVFAAGPGAVLAGHHIPAWPAPPPLLDQLVGEACRSNLALAGESLEVERAAAGLASARSHYLPRLDLAARYSLAEGGRTIDLPLGDLLNDAYATLNQYLVAQGRSPQFRTLANTSIALLRPQEQETKLRLVQPLYAPEIARSVRAARAGLAARTAALAAYRRQLRAEVHEAFFRHELAVAAVATHQSALALVDESLRVARSLARNDKVTEDVVLRAEAERATVAQQLADATKDRHLARSYLNFLLNRPLTTDVPSLASEDAAAYATALAATALPASDADGREELASLAGAESAARAGADTVAARQRPTLAVAVEGGLQGESYRVGSGSRYTLGSLVLDWNLFDGAQRRAELAQARIAERQAGQQLAATRQQLELQLQQARDEFAVARASLATASLRLAASRSSYALVARREAEGLASQLTVLDARHTLTAAELNHAMTRARLCIAAAQFDRAAALSPLP